MKTAIVHEWLVKIGGSEKTLQSIAKLYPSDLFTLVAAPGIPEQVGVNPDRVTTSLIQRLPRATRAYRSYLPFFPFAVEQFDVSPYELVISSTHAVAKGVLTRADQLHIAYCYSPIRYAWDLYHQYLKEANLERGIKATIAKWILHSIRQWDYSTRNRPDYYVGISHYIARRIEKIYGIPASVIYPPVDVDDFSLTESKDDFYLTASRLVPYKKLDLIVEAFQHLPHKKLIVIGDGPQWSKVKAKAGKNVELLGYQPFEVLKKTMQQARAFLFAAEEDFGIVSVEAQACGTPVIYFNRGGSTETNQAGMTGIPFEEQSIGAIVEAIALFEKKEATFDPRELRKHAEKFSRARFEKEFKAYVSKRWEHFQATGRKDLVP